MDLRILFFLSFIWIFMLLLCIGPLVEGCSFGGITMAGCMVPDKNSVSDSCCSTLNQAVEAGFQCLCLFISSFNPLFTKQLMLPFLNCFISVPSLTECPATLAKLRAPASPVPWLIPPARPVPFPYPPTIPVPWQLPVQPSPVPLLHPPGSPIPLLHPPASSIPREIPPANPIPLLHPPPTSPVPWKLPPASPMPLHPTPTTPVPWILPPVSPVPLLNPPASPMPLLHPPPASPVPPQLPPASPIPLLHPPSPMQLPPVSPVPLLHPPASPVPSIFPPGIISNQPQPPPPENLTVPTVPEGVPVSGDSASNKNRTMVAKPPCQCDRSPPNMIAVHNGYHEDHKTESLLKPGILVAVFLYAFLF